MTANDIIKTQKMINMSAYGDNWLHILLKMTGSFGCVVTSKQWFGMTLPCFSLPQTFRLLSPKTV